MSWNLFAGGLGGGLGTPVSSIIKHAVKRGLLVGHEIIKLKVTGTLTGQSELNNYQNMCGN